MTEDITTDDGLTGIGEAGYSAEYFPTLGPAVMTQLAPPLIGEDPRDVTRLWHKLHDATHIRGRKSIETYALSGVDIALWDLLGKSLDTPVYRLLGADKHRVRAYYAPASRPSRRSPAKSARRSSSATPPRSCAPVSASRPTRSWLARYDVSSATTSTSWSTRTWATTARRRCGWPTSLKLAELVTDVLPLEDWERAFALVGSIEVAITPGD